jgi:predicted ATPase
MAGRSSVDRRIPFIGRDNELRLLARRLAVRGCVTIVGPGGVGKSRLALEAAERWSEPYASAMNFIRLVGVAPDDIAGTVAAALEIPREPGRSVLDALEDAQRRGRLDRRTIVLDNCEDAVTEVRDVVNRLCKHNRLVVIATSRVPLQIENEAILQLAPFGDDDGIAFFEARAQLTKTAFSAGGADTESIRGIVRRLDGLAVAIDLAAARLISLNVRELADELSDLRPYHFRSSASREPRHWTLNHVVDWSLSKLDNETRNLFALAGRFAHVFTPADIAAISDYNVAKVTQCLDELAKHSLLARAPGAPIYSMLAPIRAVAKQRYSRLSNRRDVDKRFARFMDEFGTNLVAGPNAAHTGELVAAITGRYDDFVSVLGWALAHETPELASVLGVFAALTFIWADAGRFEEGQVWSERLVSAADKLEARERGRVYYGVLRVAHAAGDFERMLELGSRLISLFTITNDRLGLARAYNALSVASLSTNDPARARTYVETSLSLYESIDHRIGTATALINQGNVALEGYDDPSAARECYLRALELARDAEFVTVASLALGNLANAAYRTRNFDETERWAQAALEQFTSIGYSARAAWMHHYLARVALARLNAAAATQMLWTMIGLLERQPNPEYLALCAESTVSLLLATGQAVRGAAILGAAKKFRSERNAPAIGSALLDVSADTLRLERSLTAAQLSAAAGWADAIEPRELAVHVSRALNSLIQKPCVAS